MVRMDFRRLRYVVAFGAMIGLHVESVAEAIAEDSDTWYERPMSEVREAAERGDVGAQLFLGKSYAFGGRIPKDEEQAISWLEVAANQGDAEAQFLLGNMYLVRDNMAQGITWLGKAAEQNHGGAKKSLRELAVIFENQAENGSAHAQAALGMMHEWALFGTHSDERVAAKWYRAAAEQGHAFAQFRLGARYANGMGVPEDYHQAAIWYRKAAESGVLGAQAALGAMYSSGKGAPKDDQEAAMWYRKAAELGHSESQALLGLMYSQGTGVPKDYVRAYAWLNLSSAQGSAKAGGARDTIAAMMTREQVAEAQNMSRELELRIAASAD